MYAERKKKRKRNDELFMACVSVADRVEVRYSDGITSSEGRLEVCK